MNLSESLEFLKRELKNDKLISALEISEFINKLRPVTYKKNTLIFPKTEKCEYLLFIVKGVVAAETELEDRSAISRFFQQGDVCTNIESAFSQLESQDNIISITTVFALKIDIQNFLEIYNKPSPLGNLFRKRILESMVKDKIIATSKILYSNSEFDDVMREKFPNLYKDVPSKYIASFMGISPESYSRLRSKKVNKL